MSVANSFKQSTTYDHRVALSSRILGPGDKIPVIVEQGEFKQTPKINRCKYISPRDISFGQFAVEIRKNIPRIDSSVAIFYYLSNNMLPTNSTLMGNIYDQHKDEDGFLYITYCAENTFG